MSDDPKGREPRDQKEQSPKKAAEQDGPVQERPTTLQEDAGMDVAHLDDPPQAEGPREDD